MSKSRYRTISQDYVIEALELYFRENWQTLGLLHKDEMIIEVTQKDNGSFIVEIVKDKDIDEG